jgi:hypothetical protein
MDQSYLWVTKDFNFKMSLTCAGGVAQVVEHEALSLNCYTTTTTTKTKNKQKNPRLETAISSLI